MFMAGETILVVDDSVVNLKLAAAVLRSDGYRVTAGHQRRAGADDAAHDPAGPGAGGRPTARDERAGPDAPDPRRYRAPENCWWWRSPRRSDAECEQQAYEAGCDGFIAKPIDTRTLGPRLRNFLEGPAKPCPKPGDADERPSGRARAGRSGNGEPAPQFPGRRVCARCAACSNSSGRRWTRRWPPVSFISGSARRERSATWNLPSRRAQPRPCWPDVGARQDLRAGPQRSGRCLRRAAGGRRNPDSSGIAQELERKRIALVGFADEEAERICVAFERVRRAAAPVHGRRTAGFRFDTRLQRGHGACPRGDAQHRLAAAGFGGRGNRWSWWAAATT